MHVYEVCNHQSWRKWAKILSSDHTEGNIDKTPLFLNLVNFNLAIQSLAKNKLCNHYDVNLMIDSGSLQSSIQPFPYVTLLTILRDIFCCRKSATVLRCTSCQCRWSPSFMTAVPTTARTCCHGYRKMSPSTFCPSWIQVGVYGSLSQLICLRVLSLLIWPYATMTQGFLLDFYARQGDFFDQDIDQ